MYRPTITGHTEMVPRFKVSCERPEKRVIDLATPGFIVQRVIHYTTAAPLKSNRNRYFDAGMKTVNLQIKASI